MVNDNKLVSKSFNNSATPQKAKPQKPPASKLEIDELEAKKPVPKQAQDFNMKGHTANLANKQAAERQAQLDQKRVKEMKDELAQKKDKARTAFAKEGDPPKSRGEQITETFNKASREKELVTKEQIQREKKRAEIRQNMESMREANRGKDRGR